MRYKYAMTKTKKSLHERRLDAETRASTWLADANELAESGDKARAERYYEKAQFWLDRANELELEEFCARNGK